MYECGRFSTSTYQYNECQVSCSPTECDGFDLPTNFDPQWVAWYVSKAETELPPYVGRAELEQLERQYGVA